ncbi:TfoX/Sxy family protein [Gloeobacter violaceus]|uniref:Glr2678 protein n=1 Tax=Gloeobacter violaceus (strain ATCC 29082 / PCC 7421) TaxID=251221 RepID=Q7NH59_GLOVI|nr:TfoX/Sxy family protein [Gloeobacter violaceus]BAC90619.1 glr2678 [Gloeobacter violaceus PCC 7421]
MASDESFVTYVCDQMAGAGHISSRKMFGEYAIYYGVKVVALVCDNQLFIKPTPTGKTAIGNPVEAIPYPGAKPQYLVTDRLDDKDWLARLVAATARDLPEPKPKKPKAARKSK